MKCNLCGHVIPDGKKYCPGCGRVVSRPTPPAAGRRPVAGNAPEKQQPRTQYNPGIQHIFSSDPNAPEYKDPHAYNKATALAMEYDKTFLGRTNTKSNINQNDISKCIDNQNMQNSMPAQQRRVNPNMQPVNPVQQRRVNPNMQQQTIQAGATQKAPDVVNKPEETEQKQPPKKINANVVIILIAIIAGIAICVTGVFKIGQQFGFWGEAVTTQSVQPEDPGKNQETTKNNNGNNNDNQNENGEPVTSKYKTGVYTVKSENSKIHMYKTVSANILIATVPNNTIIEITEISGDYGKAKYDSYTGWVSMLELKFTPNESPTVPETTTQKPEEEETTLTEEKPTEEVSTQNEEPTYISTPGVYTVSTTAAGLNVRDTNSIDGNIIATIPNGETVEVIEVKSSWGKIYMDGAEAWVYMKYLK